MRKLVYFIASTIDGFIADPDGNTDMFSLDTAYLSQLQQTFPETFPTHACEAMGITAPGTRFDTVVMGRNTYDPALRLGITSPYAHLRQYVFSRSLNPSPDSGVHIIAGDPVAILQDLKVEDTGRDIWLCGGGNLATQLITEIDELILKLNPVILGKGRPLFGEDTALHSFKLVKIEHKEADVALVRYTR